MWLDASHITMATMHVLNHHLRYGFENTCVYFLKISCQNWCTRMGVYGLELSDGSSSTDILYVTNFSTGIGSFSGVNIDTLTPHPQTYEIP